MFDLRNKLKLLRVLTDLTKVADNFCAICRDELRRSKTVTKSTRGINCFSLKIDWRLFYDRFEKEAQALAHPYRLYKNHR